MQLQVVYSRWRYFVGSTIFFPDTGKLVLWFLFKIKRLSLWEIKKGGRGERKHSKKRLQFSQRKSKTPGAERDKELSDFSVHFLCKNRPSISTKTCLLIEDDSRSVVAAPVKELSKAGCQGWLQPPQPPETPQR